MAIKAATRRTECFSGTPTCKYWLAGRCNRNPCRFLHSLTPSQPSYYHANTPYYKYTRKPNSSAEWTTKYSKALKPRSSKYESKAVKPEVSVKKTADIDKAPQNPSVSICKYWMNDNCVHGDQCQNLHSWSFGDGLSTLAKLHEHKKVITGIALPVGSDKLYSGSTDGTLRTWDCHTGCCVNVKNLGVEITSLISEGPWVFAGVKNAVKAWNVQTDSEFTLDGPKGQVLSMIVGNDTLLAGAEMIIYAWRGSSDPKAKFPFQLAHALPREWINLEPLLLLRGCKHPRYHARSLHRFRFSFEVIQVASI